MINNNDSNDSYNEYTNNNINNNNNEPLILSHRPKMDVTDFIYDS